MAERQTHSSSTPVDRLLRLMRNNALLEVKHFACSVANMSTLTQLKSASYFKNVTYWGRLYKTLNYILTTRFVVKW